MICKTRFSHKRVQRLRISSEFRENDNKKQLQVAKRAVGGARTYGSNSSPRPKKETESGVVILDSDIQRKKLSKDAPRNIYLKGDTEGRVGRPGPPPV